VTHEEAVYRRVLRRETHAALTAPAVVAASVLALTLAASLALVGLAAVDPGIRRVVSHSRATILGAPPVTRMATGIIALLVAALLLTLALRRGRRARHARVLDRIAMVVDDGILADASADRVASRCRLPRSQVGVTVHRRTVRVRVIPTSGVAVDRDAVADAVVRPFIELGFDVTTRVTVTAHGVVS
jgi:hypothetical protein